MCSIIPAISVRVTSARIIFFFSVIDIGILAFPPSTPQLKILPNNLPSWIRLRWLVQGLNAALPSCKWLYQLRADTWVLYLLLTIRFLSRGNRTNPVEPLLTVQFQLLIHQGQVLYTSDNSELFLFSSSNTNSPLDATSYIGFLLDWCWFHLVPYVPHMVHIDMLTRLTISLLVLWEVWTFLIFTPGFVLIYSLAVFPRDIVLIVFLSHTRCYIVWVWEKLNVVGGHFSYGPGICCPHLNQVRAVEESSLFPKYSVYEENPCFIVYCYYWVRQSLGFGSGFI